MGGFSVGKTSLIQCYAHKKFNETYSTTIGVKIYKKQLAVNEVDLELMIWDLAGVEDFGQLAASHLRGLSAYIVVIDGTRQNSFKLGLALHEHLKAELGERAAVFALNKFDLQSQWMLSREHIRALVELGYPVIETSAKLDQGVDEMFLGLARQLAAAPLEV